MLARLALVSLATVLVAAACGGAKPAVDRSVTSPTTPVAVPKGPPPRQFLAVDRAAHRVTVTLIASYDGTNGGFNFDGYSRELLWTVPLGWTIQVVCKNRGPLRHSCVVVTGAGTTRPAFPGAATPQPLIGLEAGTSATFSFRATKVGHYRFASLAQGEEVARIWDVLEIARSGEPSVVSLLAGG